MKLVDILVRELKVWPEGVSAISQGGITGELYDSSFQIIEPVISVSIADDRGCPRVIHDAAIVTRAQWQAAVDALKAEKAVEWNGEGLPPVGIDCERSFSYSTWKATHICGHSTDGAYAAFYDGDGLMGWDDNCKFRPIRTPEQIAAEEIQRIRDEIKWQKPQLGPCPVEQMYLLGYRKFEIVDN